MDEKNETHYCQRIEAACPHKFSKANKTCFIMMSYTQVYSEKIEAMLRKVVKNVLHLEPILAKDLKQQGSSDVFCTRICRPIKEARLCLADVTYTNTNVGFEMGISQELSKPVIITIYTPKKIEIKEKDKTVLDKLQRQGIIQYSEVPANIPSDITGIFRVEYKDYTELYDRLAKGIDIKQAKKKK